ncbi:MAG: GIY-YIG nuclease family protein [Actinobacteria bacterium]|nr:GIY-YIG nuclease family protein [Actinomycetota bacterium]
MFLIDATPEGMRLTDTSGWMGSCLDFARADYARARERPELTRCGVYVLVGTDNDTSGEAHRVYVGESDIVGTRIDGHYKAKDFWNRAYVFTTKDDSLNKAHVRYLEARLIRRGIDAHHAAIENGTAPDARGLSEPELADMQAFLDEVLLILPVLGVSDFQLVSAMPIMPAAKAPSTTVTSKSTPNSYFLKEKKVTAEGRDDPAGFIVLAGARASAVENVMSPAYKTRRSQLIETGILIPQEDHRLLLTKDTIFPSPSAAASVIAGGNRNGLQSWKDATDHTLAENQAAVVDNSTSGATKTESSEGPLEEVPTSGDQSHLEDTKD